MSHPQPRQQSGFNDMPLWQQQFMLKQLQELQRQQQFQQLEEATHDSSMAQMSAMSKRFGGDQLPPFINGTPIHEMSNTAWPTEFTGGDSKVPTTLQMLMVGNMNWVQHGSSPAVQGFPNGLTFSHEQGQMLHSVGNVPQQLDQSYGNRVAGARGAPGQYSYHHGISHDSTDTLIKGAGNQVDKPMMQLSAFTNFFQGDQCAAYPNQVYVQDGPPVFKQGFQGKNLMGLAPGQGLNSGILSGNFQPVNSLTRNAVMQDLHGRQEQSGWSGHLQEKIATHVDPSQSLVSLDPTEEKILFTTDEGIWGAPIGGSTSVVTRSFVNPLEGTDNLSVFPSIQSGSWSALMQSAVAEASSSDTGLQEEWSGLSFQKTELSTGNEPVTFNESRTQQSLVDNNLQTSSPLSSRHSPLFDDVNMSPSVHTVPQQKPVVEGNQQIQQPMYLENASEGAWASRFYGQSENSTHTADPKLNAQNMQGYWAHQQGLSLNNIYKQPSNKPNGWNFNEPLSFCGNNTLNIHEHGNTGQDSQNSVHGGAMHKERGHDGAMWMPYGNRVAVSFPNSAGELDQIQSGTDNPYISREDSGMNRFASVPNSSLINESQETNQQVPNSLQLDYIKHVDPSAKYNGNGNMGQYQGLTVLESLPNNFEKRACETYEKMQENCYQKENSNDSYNSNAPHHTLTGDGLRENVWLSAGVSHPMAGSNQKTSGLIGRKPSGTRRFHYHPMGNSGMNVEPADSVKHLTHSQALSQQVSRGLKSHEQGYLGQSKLVDHVNCAFDAEKGNEKGSEEFPSRSILSSFESTVSAPSDRSGSFCTPNRNAQKSQNMLELLQKVDQSKEHGMSVHLRSHDHNLSSGMPEARNSDAYLAHLQHTQSSSSQGFGLQLAPPSRRPSTPNHSFSQDSQMVNDTNSRHADSDLVEKGNTWLCASSPAQSLPLPHETSQRECGSNEFGLSGQRGNESSYPGLQANFSTASISGMHYPRNQLQEQHIANASGQSTRDHSVNIPSDRFSSHFRQRNESHNRALTDQSVQASLAHRAGRIPPFSIGPTFDNSHLTSAKPSHPRVSGQQHSTLEAVPASQPPVISGSQHGAFSTMLHTVWANLSSQQRLATSQSQKFSPNIFQSVNQSNNSLETASWAQQKQDEREVRKGGKVPSEFGAHAMNSQGTAYGEKQPGKESSWQHTPSEKVDPDVQTVGASQWQASAMKHLSDATSIAASSWIAQTHQQDFDRGRDGRVPNIVSQRDQASFQNPAASKRDFEAFGRSLKPSNVLHQNYSLLHQAQAMKSMETDPSKRGLKRFRGSDSGLDPQQVAAKEEQQLLYGYKVRDDVDDELNAAVQRATLPSGDSKMLSFLPEGREDPNKNASSQIVLGDITSQGMVTFGVSDSQSCCTSNSISSARVEHPQISPQMAPSWFEQYGTFKNGQMLQVYGASRTAKAAAQKFFFGRPSDNLQTHALFERVNAADASTIDNVWQSKSTTSVASENFSSRHSLQPELNDQSLVVRPKRHKSATSKLLPWREEVTQGSERLHTISMADKEWAQAANRLIEKVEDEAEMIEDGQGIFHSKRRLVLTTKLMQQLLRPAPSAILSADATSEYESAAYFAAKLALGDACSLICCSGSDSCVSSNNANMVSEKTKTSEIVGDQYFSKVVEEVISRTRKVENELLRLDKRASILDIKLECQDLEKISVINRFGRFHGRGQVDVAEASSSSDAAVTPQKTFPQRYVTALPMPRNIPEGLQCLSL